VYTKFGLKIRDCFLMRIDSQYVRQGDVDPDQLLVMDDVTSEVDGALQGMEDRVRSMLDIISHADVPDIDIGPHCKEISGKQYDCPLIPHCWPSLPDNNVFELYRGGSKCWDLFDQGVLLIKDIPDAFKLSDNQKIQKEVAVSGVPHIDKQTIKEFLDQLEYPLYFLDFETVNPAVPLFDGSRPYQQVPFQFSLHVRFKDSTGDRVEHHEYLHPDSSDPRPVFMSELRRVLGSEGSIVVFNQSFEIGKIREFAEYLPGYKDWYEQLLPRFVDLIQPFRSFHWHSPLQHGSNSIKHVLPAMTGKGYSGLDIADGGTASMAFLDMTFGEMSDEQKQKTRKDLLKYCGLDTEAMIWLVDELRRIS
jgi:hypothetical protein